MEGNSTNSDMPLSVDYYNEPMRVNESLFFGFGNASWAPAEDPYSAWNGSIYPSGYSQLRIIVTAFFVTFIMVVIVVGNMLVCIAIATEKALKTVQNWFIASLAVSDFLVGLLIMPFSLAKELMGYWIFGEIWCEIHAALDVLLCTASINNLCLISLDRYWSITQAVKYLKKRTQARAVLMICFVWVLSALISLPPLLGWKKEERPEDYPSCSLSEDVGYVLYSALGSFYIPAVVMVFVYIRIFLAARSRARRHVKKALATAPPRDKSTTTTTTCTSFSNPSPTEKAFRFPELPKTDRCQRDRSSISMMPHIIIEASQEMSVTNDEDQEDEDDQSPDGEEVSSHVIDSIIPRGLPGFHVYSPTSHPPSVAVVSTEVQSHQQVRRTCAVGSSSYLSSSYSSTDKAEACSIKPNVIGGHNRQMISRPLASDAERQKKRLAKARERRATLILGLIMAAFILAWLPFFVLYVLEALCSSCIIEHTGFAIAFWLGYCNSALNPIIYTIFNRDFRRSFKKILLK